MNNYCFGSCPTVILHLVLLTSSYWRPPPEEASHFMSLPFQGVHRLLPILGKEHLLISTWIIYWSPHEFKFTLKAYSVSKLRKPSELLSLGENILRWTSSCMLYSSNNLPKSKLDTASSPTQTRVNLLADWVMVLERLAGSQPICRLVWMNSRPLW